MTGVAVPVGRRVLKKRGVWLSLRAASERALRKGILSVRTAAFVSEVNLFVNWMVLFPLRIEIALPITAERLMFPSVCEQASPAVVIKPFLRQRSLWAISVPPFRKITISPIDVVLPSIAVTVNTSSVSSVGLMLPEATFKLIVAPFRRFSARIVAAHSEIVSCDVWITRFFTCLSYSQAGRLSGELARLARYPVGVAGGRQNVNFIPVDYGGLFVLFFSAFCFHVSFPHRLFLSREPRVKRMLSIRINRLFQPMPRQDSVNTIRKTGMSRIL